MIYDVMECSVTIVAVVTKNKNQSKYLRLMRVVLSLAFLIRSNIGCRVMYTIAAYPSIPICMRYIFLSGLSNKNSEMMITVKHAYPRIRGVWYSPSLVMLNNQSLLYAISLDVYQVTNTQKNNAMVKKKPVCLDLNPVMRISFPCMRLLKNK